MINRQEEKCMKIIKTVRKCNIRTATDVWKCSTTVKVNYFHCEHFIMKPLKFEGRAYSVQHCYQSFRSRAKNCIYVQHMDFLNCAPNKTGETKIRVAQPRKTTFVMVNCLLTCEKTRSVPSLP